MGSMTHTRSGVWVPNDRFLWNTISEVLGDIDREKCEWIYNKLYGITWRIADIEALDIVYNTK